MYRDLSGIWQCEIPGWSGEMRLPGTLDENSIGGPDIPAKQWKAEELSRIGFFREGDPIVTRLTRKAAYEGCAAISGEVDWQAPEGTRVFAETERARHLRLKVNGNEVLPYEPASVSTPYRFEVTGLLTGKDRFVFLSDNSYPGWPHDAIVYSSAATDETQTNWNGLLGWIRLRTEKQVFISGIRVYPRSGGTLDVCVGLDAGIPWSGSIRIESEALEKSASLQTAVEPGVHEIWFRDIKTAPGARLWDLEEGNLYRMSASGTDLEERVVSFGLRVFEAGEGHFTLNGRRVFLRSEANCAVFPETGYPPMDAEEWKKILLKYRAYGVNCMRFHSHCPPEAAFTAADELGMLMQPELSHWDPVNAFGTEESREYYRTELLAILRHLANHPSFVMLTFGNELHADEEGHRFMDRLLELAREKDDTRLYANGSNVHYGLIGTDPKSDFYASMMYYDKDMRATCDGMKGWLNHEYPNARRDYDGTMKAIREKTDQPVFSFEVGQYEVLPDFAEIEMYQGVTAPENLKHIQRKMREKGLEEEWRRMVEATGESSLLCYRAEVEAAMRTEGYSGISLLGLQDFPGQGTALVGMMNPHLMPKPYDFARPERFSAFFRDRLPLVLLEKYTYTEGETLRAGVKMANYGKEELSGEVEWSLTGDGYERRGELGRKNELAGQRTETETAPAGRQEEMKAAPAGRLTELGNLEIRLDGFEKPARLTLTVSFCGAENSYPIWVYPDAQPVCPENVYECRSLDAEAERILKEGGVVYLAPDSTEEALPNSIQAQFSPDFWSVCTFTYQPGGMGQLIDSDHPVFRDFPTECFNNWQWWPMANQRAMILPEKIDRIVAEMDSYAFLRPMAKLFECRCENGKLLVSSFALHRLMEYPEARALQQSIYDYISSERFQPRQRLSCEWIRSVVK